MRRERFAASTLICTGSLSGRWAGRSSPSARWTVSSVPSPPLAEIACCQTIELAKVWHAADGGPFGHALKLLILTGARREEITQLKWAELAGDTISLPGERTKTGEPRIIPLSAPALALLSALPRIGAFVFTADGTKPVNGWSRAKRRLDAATGINQPWVVHDIRRTVATGCQKLGVSLQTVEALLGHTGGSRAGVVGVYQRHDFADEKRAAVEQWGAHVASV